MKKLLPSNAVLLWNKQGQIISMHADGVARSLLRENLLNFSPKIQCHLNRHGCWHGVRNVSEGLSAKVSIYRMHTADDYMDVEWLSPDLSYGPWSKLLQPNAYLETMKQALVLKKVLAVVIFDLDDFKDINDLYGHAVGNKVLATIGKRLAKYNKGLGQCCRLGGDEFSILLFRHQNFNLQVYCQGLLAAIKKPINMKDLTIEMTASIGIAVYPKDGTTNHMLLEHADLAMYEGKNNGKNCFYFYNDGLKQISIQRMEFYHRLQQALQTNQFVLHLQPIVNLANNQIEHAEFLIRWPQSEISFSKISDLVHRIHNFDILIKLDNWVLLQGLKLISELNMGSAFKFFINISALEFGHCQNNIHAWIGVFKHYQMVQNVVLEVTEDLFMNISKQSLRCIRRIQATGANISIDEFGIGYSNFMHLQEINVKFLKISQHLIQNIHQKKEYMAIKTIIDLAHQFNLKVVAVGVETKAQLEYLRKLRCDYAQGFYFSKPLSFEDFRHFISAGYGLG